MIGGGHLAAAVTTASCPQESDCVGPLDFQQTADDAAVAAATPNQRLSSGAKTTAGRLRISA